MPSKKPQRNKKSLVAKRRPLKLDSSIIMPTLVLVILSIMLVFIVIAALTASGEAPSDISPDISPQMQTDAPPDASATHESQADKPLESGTVPPSDAPPDVEPSPDIEQSPNVIAALPSQSRQPTDEPPAIVILPSATPETEFERVKLPVLRLGRVVLDGESTDGGVITLSKFAELLARLVGGGYNTVTTEQLRSYISGSGELPPKPLLITFDGGYESVYSLAYPLLDEFDMTAVVSVVGNYVGGQSITVGGDTPIRHASWAQLTDMVQSGFVEVSNGTYNMCGELFVGGERAGVTRLPDEEQTDYESAFRDDIERLQVDFVAKMGTDNRIFCYPNSGGDDDTERLLADIGIDITLTTDEGLNTLERGGSLTRLKRIWVHSGTDISAMIDGW